jgi:hypothetical protein
LRSIGCDEAYVKNGLHAATLVGNYFNTTFSLPFLRGFDEAFVLHILVMVMMRQKPM